jgi:hypothetical protein
MIKRLTAQQLIARLQQVPGDLPVVVQSYEAGYDPVTDVETLTVTRTPDRTWYVGVYEQADPPGETVLLLASKYNRTERGTGR